MIARLLPQHGRNDLKVRPTQPPIFAGLALSITIIAVNSLISTTSPVTAFPYDEMIFYDNMWRIVQGQHQGTDFYNPSVFGLFHVGAAWWWLLGPHHYILPLTSATFSAAIMFCASIICARRLWFSVSYYLLICGVLAFETSAPGVYGWSFFSIGMSAFYSRLTAAALAVLFIQWFGDKRSTACRQTLSETLMSAFLLNILFVVKISALPIASVIIALRFIAKPQSELMSLKSLGILSIVLLLLIIGDFLLTGMNLTSNLHDYRYVAAIRASLASSDGIWRVLKSGLTFLSALLLIKYAHKPPAVPHLKSATAAASYVLVQLALNVSNTQPATIYIAPAFAAVLLSWRQGSVIVPQLPQQAIAAAQTKSPTLWIPTAVCLIVLVPQVLSSLWGSALAGVVKSGLRTPVVISSGNTLSLPVLSGSGDGDRAVNFAVSVNRGIEALRALKQAPQAIATIDYVNPFPALLAMPSPKGVPVVWALGYIQQPDMLSQPNRLFGDACIVMFPLRPTQVIEGNAELLASAAEPQLSMYFTIIREDEYWRVYERRDGCSGHDTKP
jgi:hypothetical protein